MTSILSAMGITQWRKRDEIVSSALRTAALPRYIFIAEKSHADLPLLNNIVKAMGCTNDDIQVILLDAPADLQELALPAVPMVIFGEALYPFSPAKAIKTVRLDDLSQNLAAKKSLWSELKRLS